MIAIRQLVSWHERARANDLPPSAVGGTKVYRCHYCPFSDPDPEVTFAHLWTHPGVDRRKTVRAA